MSRKQEPIQGNEIGQYMTLTGIDGEHVTIWNYIPDKKSLQVKIYLNSSLPLWQRIKVALRCIVGFSPEHHAWDTIEFAEADQANIVDLLS